MMRSTLVGAALAGLVLHGAVFAGSVTLTAPEEVGMSSVQLERLSRQLQRLLDQERAGGFQVLVARHGKVVMHRNLGMADIEAGRPVLGNNTGGLSGPAIKPIALYNVHLVYQECKKHNIPIIGQGGITTPEDALEFLIAGATAIGIGTALFNDPLVCGKVNDGLRAYVHRKNLAHISDLTGTLELNQTTPATQRPT